MKAYDLLVLGQAGLDLVFTDLDSFPQPGQERLAKDFLILPGGALNSYFVASGLGLKTVFVGGAGQDTAGQILQSALAALGLQEHHLLPTLDKRTTVSAVLSAPPDRGFATYASAADVFSEAAVVEKILPQTRHVHAFFGELKGGDHWPRIAASSCTLSIDMGWDAELRLEDILHYIQRSELFFLNEDEACQLCRVSDLRLIEQRLSRILIQEHGRLKYLIIKRGAEGSIVIGKDLRLEVPAIDMGTCVDTTGAGDSYCAAFIYAYLKGFGIASVARFAARAGGLAVTYYGGCNAAFDFGRLWAG